DVAGAGANCRAPRAERGAGPAATRSRRSQVQGGRGHLSRHRRRSGDVFHGRERPHQRDLPVPQGVRRARRRGGPPTALTGTPMTKGAKLGVAGVLVALVAGVLVLAAATRGNKPAEVREEKVQRRDLVASVTASGQVEPKTKADISSDVSGRIVKLAVKEGDIVKKGQFLLQIDPATYEAAVQQQAAAVASSRADLMRAKANLEQSQSALRRSQEIKKQNPTFVSDDTMEQLSTAVDVNEALYNSAQHAVDQAEAGLKNAQASLSKTTIVAPMSGQVTRLNVQQGETAIQGEFNKDAALLLTISDMKALETKVKVDETDVARIQVGDSAQVEIDAFPDTTFVGKVVEIANSSLTDPTATTTASTTGDQAVDYYVKVQLLNPPPDTRPDFSATAKIITDTRKNVLSIPII